MNAQIVAVKHREILFALPALNLDVRELSTVEDVFSTLKDAVKRFVKNKVLVNTSIVMKSDSARPFEMCAIFPHIIMDNAHMKWFNYCFPMFKDFGVVTGQDAPFPGSKTREYCPFHTVGFAGFLGRNYYL